MSVKPLTLVSTGLVWYVCGMVNARASAKETMERNIRSWTTMQWHRETVRPREGRDKDVAEKGAVCFMVFCICKQGKGMSG